MRGDIQALNEAYGRIVGDPPRVLSSKVTSAYIQNSLGVESNTLHIGFDPTSEPIPRKFRGKLILIILKMKPSTVLIYRLDGGKYELLDNSPNSLLFSKEIRVKLMGERDWRRMVRNFPGLYESMVKQVFLTDLL